MPRSTLRRVATGKSISLDSFVLVMQALRMTHHRALLLPEPSVRPVYRVRFDGSALQSV